MRPSPRLILSLSKDEIDMTVFTIGFTKTSAANFFGRLKESGVTSLIDVRLNNTSQLAGFAKAADLEYFLQEIGGIAYRPEPILAPTQDIIDSWRKEKRPWEEFEARFKGLMAERQIETHLTPEVLKGACLLCSEDKPHNCHRRLVLEYLEETWGKALDVRHL
jgi:uncharacterized protein (DUF488 family)